MACAALPHHNTHLISTSLFASLADIGFIRDQTFHLGPFSNETNDYIQMSTWTTNIHCHHNHVAHKVLQNEYHIQQRSYMCRYCVLISNSASTYRYTCGCITQAWYCVPSDQRVSPLAKLFAAGHHHGKGVKAGTVCPPQPLISLACLPQPGLPTHQTQYLLRWRS